MTKTIGLTVRGYHLDVFGHVNNARYLEFLEEARWAIFEETLAKVTDNHCSMAIVNININYRLAAVLHQRLIVDGVISRVGDKSFVMTQRVIDQETQQIIADADITCVVVDNKTGKAISLTETWLKTLACETIST